LFTIVQDTGVSSTTTVSSQAKSFTSNVASGNLIVVNAFGNGGGNAIALSVTDSQSNTYTIDSSNTGSLANLIARTIATSTGTLTVTISSTKLALISFAIYEINTGGNSFGLDSVATGSGITGTTLSTGSLALSSTDLIIAGFGLTVTGLTYTAGPLFTIDYSNNTASQAAFISESYINTTGSSVVPSITASLTSIWNAAAVAYNLIFPLVSVYSSDSSSGSEYQQPSLFPLNQESSISNESFYLSKSLYIFDSSSAIESMIVLISSSGAIDSGIGIEGIFDESHIPVTDSADSAFAIDQQIVISLFIDIDTSASLEFFSLSQLVSDIDSSIADLDTQQVSPGTIRMIVSYDNPYTGLESQSTHNVLASIDADSAFGSESQLPMFLAFYGTDIASASESSQPKVLSGDLSTVIDKQLFTSVMFTSADQASESETQLRTTIGGLVVTILDINPTIGLEGWLRILSPVDSSLGRENQTLSTSFLASGLTDAATSQESPLPIQLSVDSPSAQEFNLKSIFFVSADSAQANESFTYSKLIIQTDSDKTIDIQILFNSLVTIGEGLIDSSFGNESQLPIRTYYDLGIESDNQNTTIFQSSFTLSSDLDSGIETQLKIILGIENPLARDIQFVFFSTVSASSAGADSALGQETQITIQSSGESPQSIDQQISIIIDVNPSFSTDTQTVFNFSITSTAGFTESALASEAQLPIKFFGDFGSSVDGNEASTGQITIPPPSSTSITDVLVGLFIYLNSTGAVGPNNVDFVIDPDSIILYPTNPGPILLIQPLSLTDASDTIGGGRFSKTWNWDIVIHVIVDNIYDQSFKDMIISESQSHFTGPFQIAYQVQKLVEQAYLVNSNYQPVTIEFPYFLSTDKIRRYKGANSYAGLPLRFSVVFRDNLPTLNIP
jgi:hypothetical protein